MQKIGPTSGEVVNETGQCDMKLADSGEFETLYRLYCAAIEESRADVLPYLEPRHRAFFERLHRPLSQRAFESSLSNVSRETRLRISARLQAGHRAGIQSWVQDFLGQVLARCDDDPSAIELEGH